VPNHVAIIMDGNGRWAKERGLARTQGHEMGEAALFDVIEGAIEIGNQNLSAYAFSTENWRRSPEEVRWLMAFNRDVIHRRRDQFVEMGVRVHWVGRRPKLWRSVINELEIAEDMSRDNDLINLYFCVNYGGRAEIADAAPPSPGTSRGPRQAGQGQREAVRPLPRRAGHAPTSTWWCDRPVSSACPTSHLAGRLRRVRRAGHPVARLRPPPLWYACEIFASRDRRFGGAIPNPVAPSLHRPLTI